MFEVIVFLLYACEVRRSGQFRFRYFQGVNLIYLRLSNMVCCIAISQLFRENKFEFCKRSSVPI
jgi:hypothetical protein